VDSRSSLPRGTLLDGCYRMDRVIGSGGFGITYLAEDTKLRTRVAIKEYYPAEFGVRDVGLSVRPTSERHKQTFDWGRTRFLEEASTLARFRHASIVRVTRVFETNSTAYMIMDFEEGRSLEAWLSSLGRAPTQEEMDRISLPLLDALELMHAQNFLHRDIAPDNVIVRADGTPVLLDFGAARRAVAEMSRSLTGIIKTGYSPFEQYASDARLQGPWSDLYAFGATLYRAISGKAPEEATLRMADDRTRSAIEVSKGNYRTSFLNAIDACLRPRHMDRPQSVAQLRSLLLRPDPPSSSPISTTSTATRIIDRPQQRPARINWWVAAAGVAAIVVSVYGGFEYARRKAFDDEARRTEAARTVVSESKRKEEDTAKQAADVAAAKKQAEDAGAARRASPGTSQVNQDNPFVIVEPRAVFGNAITTLRNTDVEAGKSACTGTSGCIAFELGRSSKLCILFATVNSTLPLAGFVSGTRASGTSTTTQYTVAEGYALYGKPILTRSMANLDQCRAACDRASKCQAFEFSASSICILFETVNSRAPLPGFTSAMRAN
jgi:serine/threonine protein kinase